MMATALFWVFEFDMGTHTDIEPGHGPLGHRTHELLLIIHQKL